ncbi:hypothetical protein [Quadrisphaera sp. INWT6]|uniref:hypothetical protein n=1 Tax=Quadrisphaera sp. INWT6 TaxID=2596917 RepID=UPI0018924655|nr:hypothetical protein [Quadrisphaera sp. INWT6]MBF5081774.1 hypothetical protein [Quadrisphaera sp. INWT6]
MSSELSRSVRATPPGSGVHDLQAACDQLVATAADPAAARALLVRVWALGAATADGLLADLCDVAATSAARAGTEPDAAALLDALGRHEEAARVREAVRRGLDDHQRSAGAAARVEAARRAARVAARLAEVSRHRRLAAV